MENKGQNSDWVWNTIQNASSADHRPQDLEAGAESLKEADRFNRLSKAYARCFSSPEGQVVLADLRQSTLERALGPDSSREALRQLEGQRQLVLRIGHMIKQANHTPN